MRRPDQVAAAAERALALCSPCRLCPRACGAHRLRGEVGFCGVADGARLDRALAHQGEEPPISGKGGAAAFFFSGCTLRCTFCQNWQISRRPGAGLPRPIEALATDMLRLEAAGCSHLDLVSPTPHLPWILQALVVARQRGLALPSVVNTNGYLPEHTVRVYHESCEIMLLDVKYATPSVSDRLSGRSDYPAAAFAAAVLSHSLFGPLSLDDDGLARSGMLVRHLVLPGHPEESALVLRFLATLRGVTVSLMAQYHPTAERRLAPPLDRALTDDEYLAAVDEAGRAGLDHVILQEPGCGRVYLPDFGEEAPFKPA